MELELPASHVLERSQSSFFRFDEVGVASKSRFFRFGEIESRSSYWYWRLQFTLNQACAIGVAKAARSRMKLEFFFRCSRVEV